MSRQSNSTTYHNGSHSQEPKTSIVTPYTIITFRFCCKLVFGVLQKKSKTSNGRSKSTHLGFFLSRRSISTIYDHRIHPQGPKTSMITPNTIIAFRFCGKWVFGVTQKILKHLMEGPNQPILFYLCPGIIFQPHFTTGHTRWDLIQA